MLDHFHRARDVEARRLGRKLFDRGNAIVEFRTRLLGVAARRVDRGGRRIDGRDVRPKPRERFGEEPRPAADVEEIEPRKRRAGPRLTAETPNYQVTSPGDAQRRHLVQRRHRPVGIPPGLGKRVEMRDLRGNHARRALGRHATLSIALALTRPARLFIRRPAALREPRASPHEEPRTMCRVW